jgi:hypothetical protein
MLAGAPQPRKLCIGSRAVSLYRFGSEWPREASQGPRAKGPRGPGRGSELPQAARLQERPARGHPRELAARTCTYDQPVRRTAHAAAYARRALLESSTASRSRPRSRRYLHRQRTAERPGRSSSQACTARPQAARGRARCCRSAAGQLEEDRLERRVERSIGPCQPFAIAASGAWPADQAPSLARRAPIRRDHVSAQRQRHLLLHTERVVAHVVAGRVLELERGHEPQNSAHEAPFLESSGAPAGPTRPSARRRL